jgi:hypothetical protein
MAARSRKKKDTFSATKAVKANARERVGSPPPTVPLDPEQKRRKREKKHKKTLSKLLTGEHDATG